MKILRQVVVGEQKETGQRVESDHNVAGVSEYFNLNSVKYGAKYPD